MNISRRFFIGGATAFGAFGGNRLVHAAALNGVCGRFKCCLAFERGTPSQ